MLPALPEHVSELWTQYRRLEARGARSEKVDALRTFVDELLRQPDDVRRPWALALAAETVAQTGTAFVREPLFSSVVFPALLDGIDRKVPGCARWMAWFVAHLHVRPPLKERLGPDRCSKPALLRLAVAHDPEDRLARRQLIESFAHGFDYALHELPSGVLYGHDGATIGQCAELREELAEFEELTTAEGLTAHYADLITECRLHFTAYEQYLRELPRHESYAAFLKGMGRSA